MEGNGTGGCLHKGRQSAINEARSTEDITMRKLWEHLTGEDGEYNVSPSCIYLSAHLVPRDEMCLNVLQHSDF